MSVLTVAQDVIHLGGGKLVFMVGGGSGASPSPDNSRVPLIPEKQSYCALLV